MNEFAMPTVAFAVQIDFRANMNEGAQVTQASKVVTMTMDARTAYNEFRPFQRGIIRPMYGEIPAKLALPFSCPRSHVRL